MLIVMTHEKLGDFLLLTPHLRELQKIHPTLMIAVPSLLYELYQEEKVFSRSIHSKEARSYALKHKAPVLDLSYPLLENLDLPEDHLRLHEDVFRKPQHAMDAYSQALHLWFKELSPTFKSQPFLDLNTDERVLNRYSLRPFEYFTVHSGSDFPSKNWDPKNFEKTVELMLKRYPHLRCVNLVGPQDDEIFLQRTPPENFQTVRVTLRDAAHILSGSAFHIDNDSGVHHLAGALDVPSITVFGPTGPGTWSSMTKYNFVHWGGPNCKDHCGGARMRFCQDRVCLSTVLPEHLLASSDQILAAFHEKVL